MTDLEMMTTRADEASLRKALESGGAKFRGRICNCPFHDDRHPSAGIYLKDGAWHFHCHPCGWGGDVFDVRAKLNKRPLAEELTGGAKAVAEPPAKTWATVAQACMNLDVRGISRYECAGKLHGVVVRHWLHDQNKKACTQFRPVPGGYIWKGPAAPHPMYRVDTITESTREVIVVEGEPKCEALRKLGFTVVTSMGGAGKAALTDWTHLAGKTVYLWADADLPTENHPDGVGTEHMRDVQKILATLNPPCRIFRVAHEELELPDGGDAVDFLARYPAMSEEDLRGLVRDEIIARALPVGIAGDYARYMQQGIDGARRPWPWPWPMLCECRALTPGTTTVLCGDPKCGKSLLLMHCMVVWIGMGLRACVYELEDGRNYHLARAHAQVAREGRLLDPFWLEANPLPAAALTETASAELEAIGRSIWEPPANESATYQILIEWVEARAKEGFNIIVVDPVTAARPESKPWIADHDFIHHIKRIAEKYRCCPIIVIHPVKGHKGGGGGGDMSGGAAMARFCHTLLWLDVMSEDAQTTVKDSQGLIADQRVNRALRIVFARNGPGSNHKIAMHFDYHTMLFTELGEIIK